MEQEISLEDIYKLLTERGAGESATSQIRIWKFSELFKQRNDYKNLDVIGKGAGGIVYIKNINGINYAVKVMIQGKRRPQSELLNDFYQEVDSLSKFRDERILHLIGVALDTSDEDDFIFCTVTNYLIKGNLRNVINNRQLFIDEFDPNIKMLKKIKLILQISEGLQVIHNAKYAHKNLRT